MQVSTFTLGDTLNYTTAVGGYSAADGWVLKTRLVPRSSGTAISLSSTADSVDSSLHRTSVTAATTAGWTAGTYSWFAYVEKGAEQYKVNEGVITLAPNPRTATTLDNRSTAQTALDNIRAILAGRANDGVLSYRVGERELRRYTMAELITLESKFAQDVKREVDAARLAAGLASKRRTFVRFAARA